MEADEGCRQAAEIGWYRVEIPPRPYAVGGGVFVVLKEKIPPSINSIASR